MSKFNVNKGPWTHRFAIWVFATVFGVLIMWALGFILKDIGNLTGPSYEDVQAQFIDADLLEQSTELRQEIENIEREQTDLREQQTVLRDSTSESQRTMNQLLDFQRLNLQQDVTPSEAEQQALAESQQLFLSNQTRYQALNQQIADLDGSLRELREQQRTNQAELDEKRPVVNEEYERLVDRNNLKIASIKLGVLLPLIIAAVVLYLKFRSSTYSPMVYAFDLAVAYRVVDVMHQYFPSVVFKYILIGTCILVVARILFVLLQMVANPQMDWLLKQYRDAYERFLCPVCDYPIRRGPRKFLFWTRRTVHKMALPADTTEDADGSYTCPMCSTRLYEECPSCHKTRHSLLPACQHCGDVKVVEAPQSAESSSNLTPEKQ